MTFRVGQKVVCIKRGPWTHRDTGEVCPNYGDVLTIRAIDISPKGMFLRFVEIVNKPRQYTDSFGEANFWAPRFRPAVEASTDISELREIVADVFRKAQVSA